MIQRQTTRTKTRVVSALQILLLLGTVEYSMAACPARYTSIGTGCYYFDDQDRITWHQAYFMCKFDMKGYLVEIETQDEQNNIRQHIETKLDPTGKYSYWIGASDLLLENEYRWMTSGNLLSFKAWSAKTNEPNNQAGIEGCAMIRKGIDYSWNDYPCTNTGDLVTGPLRAICECAAT